MFEYFKPITMSKLATDLKEKIQKWKIEKLKALSQKPQQ